MVLSVSNSAALVKGAALPQEDQMANLIHAVALVGFYRGEQLVQPEDVLDLPLQEFAELKAFYKVDYYTPPEEPKAEVVSITTKGKAKDDQNRI